MPAGQGRIGELREVVSTKHINPLLAGEGGNVESRELKFPTSPPVEQQSSTSSKAGMSSAHKSFSAQKLQKFVSNQLFGEATLDDLDGDEDVNGRKRECCGLLHPRTPQSNLYDLVQMAMLLYIVVTVPWSLAFGIGQYTRQLDDPIYWLDIVVDLGILVDMVLQFVRYHNDEHGKLITDRKVIGKKYMKCWFWIDLLSLIPFEWLMRKLSANGASYPILRDAKLLRLGRLVRLTRIFGLHKLMEYVNDQLKSVGVSKPHLEFIGRVAYLSTVVSIIVHVLGSFWIFLSRGLTLDRQVPNWYSEEYRHMMAHDSDNSGFIEDDELLAQLNNANHPQRGTVYIAGCYWVLTTMSTVGFGEIVPHNDMERVFGMFVILTGAFVWAFIVGSFCNTLNNMDKDKSKYDESLRSLRAIMRFHDVPEELTDRVEAYFEYKYGANHTMFNESLYESLPVRLRADLIMHRYRDIIEAIPFFHGCHTDAILDIVSHLKSFSVLPSDYIFREGDPSCELVVLTKGICAMVNDAPGHDAEPGQEEINIEYRNGSYFGENNFLGMEKQRMCSIRARTFCEVSTLHPDDMQHVLNVHLRLRRRLEHYAKMKAEMESRMLEGGDGATNTAELDAMKSEVEARWDDQTAELREAFEAADKDSSGFLDRSEIAMLATEMGASLHDWQIDEAFRAMDIDGSGEVDFEEFAEWWLHKDSRLDFSDRSDPTAKVMRNIQENVLESQLKLTRRVERMEAKVDSQFAAIRTALEANSAAVLELKR